MIFHVLLAGVLIHFQMAIGIPFFILSFLYGLFVAVKAKKKKHIMAYLLTFITLANFLIFDLRHEFLLLKTALRFLTPLGSQDSNIISMLYQRIKFMTTGIEFLRPDPGYRNLIIFLISSFFLFYQIREKKYRSIYYTFLYFYFGYLLLSNLNSGGLLYFYLFPLFPFVFLIFSSFTTSRYDRIFIMLFLVIFLFNQRNAVNDVTNAETNFIEKNENSWLFLKNAGTNIFQGEETEFGYFVYHPDIVAYKPKYAMRYLQQLSDKKGHYFTKKTVTYLFIAPPPRDNPYMKDEWWRINQVHIVKEPQQVFKFENGYKIEKYLLDKNEVQIPFDKGIDPGLHFR